LPVRLAVIGAGDVAQRDYLPELPRLGERAEAIVVCARSGERARDVADRFGIPRWTTSYEEAVGAEDVDAVLNLTPFSLHLEVTLASLAAGKHVYSEKPLALNISDCDRIISEATGRGLILVAAPSVMLFPQVRRTQRMLADGTLGPVHSARGLALGGVPPWNGYISDPTPFFAWDTGPLVDMAVYPLHALTGLLGPARRVSALSGRSRDAFVVADGPYAGQIVPVDAHDNWHLIVELEGGCLASVQANNCVRTGVAPDLELQGEQGTLALSLLDVGEPVRIVADRATAVEHVPHERAAGPDHLLGVAHLVSCLETGCPSVLSGEHARHVVEVLEAARRSTAEGATVDVVSDFPRLAVQDREEVSADAL
jgi:predicted dehydrogenase